MREILFRGKSRKYDTWVIGLLTGIPQGIPSYRTDYAEIYDLETHETYSGILPETVGQFTGLKDKKGNPIFEGDIVRHDAFGNRAICWGTTAWDNMAATGWWLSKTIVPLCSSNNSVEGYNDEIEVIGNIHDNPELLEVSG